jgi:membrane associated rhomboid family serine protease
MLLLGLNVLVFVLLQLHLLRLYITEEQPHAPWGDDLMLSANSSLEVMIHRPWTLITHLFAHIQPGHFLFNMIALFSMGKIFMTMVGPRKLVWLYLLGGISGYLLFALSFASSGVLNGGRDVSILGASAAVMSIVVAAAIVQPRRIVYLFNAVRLELAWLAILLVVLDLASIRQGINGGGHIGHLGGALFGAIYGLLERAGIRNLRDIGLFLKKTIGGKSMRVVHSHTRPKTDEQYNTERVDKQKKIDGILDKIGQSGYESLSQTEKDFLFKHSQK